MKFVKTLTDEKLLKTWCEYIRMSNEAYRSIQFAELRNKSTKRLEAQEEMYNARYEAAEDEIHLRHKKGVLSNYKECCFQGVFDN